MSHKNAYSSVFTQFEGGKNNESLRARCNLAVAASQHLILTILLWSLIHLHFQLVISYDNIDGTCFRVKTRPAVCACVDEGSIT